LSFFEHPVRRDALLGEYRRDAGMLVEHEQEQVERSDGNSPRLIHLAKELDETVVELRPLFRDGGVFRVHRDFLECAKRSLAVAAEAVEDRDGEALATS